MLRLTTLGATDLRDRLGKPVREVLAQPKRLALLVYLAVEGQRGPIPRDRLLATFWPESDAERARNSLSQALHQLRQVLGPGVVESRGSHALGVSSDRLWCDAVVFGESLRRNEARLALDLYRGDFCPALFVAGAPGVEEWLDARRRLLRSSAIAAAQQLAPRLAERGDREGAARVARAALALRPDEEAVVRDLLALLERTGDSAGALLAYQDYAKRLATELDTEPEPATRRLIDDIRRRREAPTPVAPLPALEPQAAAVEPAPVSAPRRRWRPAVVAVTACLLLAAVVAVLRARFGRATPPSAKAVAVFPFTVRGDTALAYLREGMMDLVSVKLAGSPGVRAVDPRAVSAAERRDAAADAEARRRVARRLGAAWFITGDIVEVAGRLQVNSALYNVDGGPQALAAASVTGDTSALFQLVDDLSGRVLAELLGGRDTALTRLAAVTTQSLPALRAYLAGEQALRAGRDAQAGAAFHDAATIDTAFALAQYRLALTANWVTIPGVNPVDWARTAARHSQRLTPMLRDLLNAYQAYKEVRWADAERMYRSLTAAYPDHVEAWLMLGEVYFHYNWLHGSPPAEAWEPLERVRALDPGNVHALIHLARLAALEGRVAALDSLVEAFVRRYGDAERSLELRALRAYVHDDRAQRSVVARELRDADDVVAYSVLEAAFVYAQHADATLELEARFDAARAGGDAWPAVGATARRLLLSVGPATGRWGKLALPWTDPPEDGTDWAFETRVLMAAEPAIPLPRPRIVALRDSLRARRPYRLLMALTYSDAAALSGAELQRYLDGLLSVRLGEYQPAEQAAGELAAAGADGRRRPAAMLAHALRAEIAHAAGDDRHALAELDHFELAPTRWTTLPTHWGTRARFLRAEILLALGREEEAADFYDSIFTAFDAAYLALAHLRRAQIHTRHGEVEQARFHYGRFLSWWKDCDPEFRPLLEQARRELAALGPAPQ